MDTIRRRRQLAPKRNVSGAGTKRLLIVGSRPPPLGGATVTVQALLDELSDHPSVRATLVDTRFSQEYRHKTFLLQMATVRRALSITWAYLREVRGADSILVFANNSFVFTLVPLLYFLARIYRKPFYLKPIGGDLDVYLASQGRLRRRYLLCVLRALDGILAQTKQLQASLRELGCRKTAYVPGCRPCPADERPVRTEKAEEFRLVFLSQIKPEKGVLVILDALQHLARNGSGRVRCDFYGPIYEETREEFFHRLEALPAARYCGVVPAGSAARLIAEYDALVLPTFFPHEGHPGVVIEAMQAGVPVISTEHRAIPELIAHGENGLLVPVRDSRALAGAIHTLESDAALRERMGSAGRARGQAFCAHVVVPLLLRTVFPETARRWPDAG